jgi:hypothetical protein
MTDQNKGQFGQRSDTQEQAKKGGQSQSKENNSGNLANRSPQDREATARKGGEASHSSGGS